MDQLIAEIEAYAAARGIKPATVVQYATTHGGGVFDRWKAGKGTCTLPMADRIRAYMRENPAPAAGASREATPVVRSAQNGAAA